MAQEEVHRRLSAILAADVVDYSRMMEADEAGTLAALRKCRHSIIEPLAKRHQGRIFKTMGDGFLIEFGSVVGAVQCALDFQANLGSPNTEWPDGKRIRLRIGVNLGDVLVEHDDLFGDGVNIAARLQAMAKPESILLSGTVFDHLKGKIEIGFEFLGERQVKNIAKPIRVYRALTSREDAGRLKRGSFRTWRRLAIATALGATVTIGTAAVMIYRESSAMPALVRPNMPSIAVLPFTNMSGDAEQAYFANGMTDDLITDLSQISGLFVISRNSTFPYKDKNQDIRQIARELGVRFVLEGSIQRAGDQVRVNAQLIDADTGGHVWADRYDGSLSDVFRLQDSVTGSIADALALRLTSEQRQVMGQRETNVPAAYDAFLRGWDHFRRATTNDYSDAIQRFEQAIELDPEYGRAYAALALVQEIRSTSGWHRGQGDFTSEVNTEINRNLVEAQKRPTSTYYLAAGVLAASRGLYQSAVDAFTKAIAMDPSDSWSYAYMARALTFWGKPSEAIPFIQTAMRVDPHFPPVFLSFRGLAQFSLEQYEQAAESLEIATKANPEDAAAFLLLGATYGYLERKEEAQAAVAAFDSLMRHRGLPPITATFAWNTWGFKKRHDRDRLFEGLLLAGVPESLPREMK